MDENQRAVFEAIEKAKAESAGRTEAAFFHAWRDAITVGVEWIGPKILPLFGPRRPEEATSKWDLHPLIEPYRQAMGVYSTTEAMYLGTLYSFYNMEDGQELLTDRLGTQANIAEILTRMDTRAREAIFKLSRTFPGR